MHGITKRFPGVVALRDVSLSLATGEVLSLMGENGAGKSTLMKILGGAYLPDDGTIELEGKPVVLSNVREHGGQEVMHLHLHVVGGRRLGRMLPA